MTAAAVQAKSMKCPGPRGKRVQQSEDRDTPPTVGAVQLPALPMTVTQDPPPPSRSDLLPGAVQPGPSRPPRQPS